MPKLVCTKCEIELYPKKNEVYVVENAQFGPYKIWSADLWACPSCKFEIVAGFGQNPIAERYQEHFKQLLDRIEAGTIPVFYINPEPKVSP